MKDILMKVNPSLEVPDTEDNNEVKNVIITLLTIKVTYQEGWPSYMFSPELDKGVHQGNDVTAIKAEDPISASTAVNAEDSSEDNNKAAKNDTDNNNVIPVTASNTVCLALPLTNIDLPPLPLLFPASTNSMPMAWLASPRRTPELSTPWRQKLSQSR
jgi:hypothetical protein